jgi:predicted MPP superfamily phosphohydrolase
MRSHTKAREASGLSRLSRLATRLQLFLYRRGWPARLGRRLGFQPRLRVTEHHVSLPSACREGRELVVAFASDFHAGVTTDPDLLRRACGALEQVKPDLLLLGGDFVSLEVAQIDWLAPLLGMVPAPLGRFAVLGNHDRWYGADHVSSRLRAAGIEVLVNQNRRLPPPFDRIWICGLDDCVTGNPDGMAALRGAEGTRIVLTHAPGGLLALSGERFELALCGHTHGGQIALPDGTPFRAAPGPLSRRYSRGRFQVETGGVLVVSVGLGCSTLPIRVNSDPEIIVCRLSSPPV